MNTNNELFCKVYSSHLNDNTYDGDSVALHQAPSSARKKLLLIDKVDVFFSNSF